jgi:hypothetical protein
VSGVENVTPSAKESGEADIGRQDSSHLGRRLVWALGMLALASVAFILACGAAHARPNTLPYESAKAAMQVGLVAVAGAVLSFLANDYQAQRQREDQAREREDLKRAYERDLIKTTLARTTEAYSKVKRARRVLRATTTSDGAHLAEDYDRYMLEINDAELQFETLCVEVEASPSVFLDLELQKFFESIRGYLEKLITEYGERRCAFKGEPEQLAEEQLPVLGAFLGHRQSGPTFSQQFSRPKRRVQGILQHELARLAQAE